MPRELHPDIPKLCGVPWGSLGGCFGDSNTGPSPGSQSHFVSDDLLSFMQHVHCLSTCQRLRGAAQPPQRSPSRAMTSLWSSQDLAQTHLHGSSATAWVAKCPRHPVPLQLRSQPGTVPLSSCVTSVPSPPQQALMSCCGHSGRQQCPALVCRAPSAAHEARSLDQLSHAETPVETDTGLCSKDKSSQVTDTGGEETPRRLTPEPFSGMVEE